MPGFNITGQSLITRNQFLNGVNATFADVHNALKEMVIFQYTDWKDENNAEKNRDSLKKLVTEQLFICPVQEFALR